MNPFNCVQKILTLNRTILITKQYVRPLNFVHWKDIWLNKNYFSNVIYIYIYIYIHAGHCWRSEDEHISDVLLWTPEYGRAKAGRAAGTYIQQLCEDTGCSPEDLPEMMNYREKWRERVRDIRASGTAWWWWWYIYMYRVQLNRRWGLFHQDKNKHSTENITGWK